jgi:LysM repeat protein
MRLEIPMVYTLRRGEFPWCLARRYDIDPLQIMWLNGFGPGQVFYAGQQVLLPKNPLPFRGDRALHYHPATYRVQPRDTIYSVACYYGDLEPLELAAANGLQPPYLIDPGQDLSIP